MSAADDLKAVMAGVCTPVSVVTTSDGVAPHGTTVSAFASLSMGPPMIMVALDRSSNLLRLIAVGTRFGVNVLGSNHAGLASAFARKGIDKFCGVPWEWSDGAPRITGAPGWLACEATQLVDGGDHVVVLGAVLSAEEIGGAPLTYHRRSFGTHSSLEAVT